MKMLVTATTMVLGLAALAGAETLKNDQIPADARWLVHVDVDALKTAAVARTISGRWLKRPAVARALRQLKQATAMDLHRDLHDVTIHGCHYAPHGAVVTIHANLNQPQVLGFLRTRPGFHSTHYGQHQLIQWTETTSNEGQHTISACFFSPDVLVFGRDESEVKRTLDVLSGTAPSLTESDPLFAPPDPPGAMLQVRGVGLSEVPLPFQSPLLRKSKYLLAVGGEQDGDAFAQARVTTESPEIAGQLRAVVEGLLAMAKLRFDTDDEVLQLLDAVNVSTDEKTVTAECRWPASKVITLVERAWRKQGNRE